jgi:hypothetical protein
MARDAGLEELMRAQLDGLRGLVEKPMFGGLAWLWNGHLLCAARDDGALIRLGKGRDQEALAQDGVEPMVSRGRKMAGWVRVAPESFADDAFAASLIQGARQFVGTLKAK